MVFDGVLKDVIGQDLALKAVFNNVELHIFSSHLLPPDDRRMLKETCAFCRKFRRIFLLGI